MKWPKVRRGVFTDLTGCKCGRLTVVRLKARGAQHGLIKKLPLWLCKCACGEFSIVNSTNLLIGKTRSCGCLSSETTAQRNRTHGMSYTPTYKSWCKMIARCEDKRDIGYENYGGRGIKVCRRWRKSFVLFLKDMGSRPPGHTLDRIDGNSDYKPSNCRWAKRQEQSRNRRNVIKLRAFGKVMSVQQWANMTGLKPATIRYRLSLGEQNEDALKPVRHNLRGSCRPS